MMDISVTCWLSSSLAIQDIKLIFMFDFVSCSVQ